MVVAYIVMAYLVMAYTAVTYVVIADTVMAIYSYGRLRHGIPHAAHRRDRAAPADASERCPRRRPIAVRHVLDFCWRP